MRHIPQLTQADRTLFAILAQIIPQRRPQKLAIIVKPATILKFHKALVKRKYRLLYSQDLSLNGNTPEQKAKNTASSKLLIGTYSWISHCNGLFSTPIAC